MVSMLEERKLVVFLMEKELVLFRRTVLHGCLHLMWDLYIRVLNGTFFSDA